VTLAHVYESPFAAELFLGQASPEAEHFYRERAHQQAQLQFDAFVAALGPAAAHVHRRLIHGPPGLRLARLAEHLAVDLVVLGSRRKATWETALPGSVASNVAMLVPADVLLVREAATAQP
jgi:nucleotide-binding universal stress UspA family protein